MYMLIALVVVGFTSITAMLFIWKVHVDSTREIKMAYTRSSARVEDVLTEVMRRDDRLIGDLQHNQRESLNAMTESISQAVTAAADAVRPYARDEQPAMTDVQQEWPNPAALEDVPDWTDHILDNQHDGAAMGRPNIPGMEWPPLASDPLPQPNLAGETYGG